MVIAILLLIVSYLLGSIPFGLLISKLIGKDLRNEGSGNIGSTNAIRVLGKKLGLVAAFFDILKGAIVILIVYLLEALGVWYNPFIINGESLYIVYGIAAIFGHCFSIFLKFKGGKAVATSLGVLLTVMPWVALIILVVFFITVLICGYVSVGSTAASLSAIAAAFSIYGAIYHQWFSCCFVIVMAFLIIIRHINNYKRLANGTESCFKEKKKLY